MQEIKELIELIMNSSIFKITLSTTVITLVGWAFIGIKKTNNKIKNAATKDDVCLAKNEAFKYTDDRMKIHEDLQLSELTNMKKNIDETHKMVSVIYTNAINKS